MTNHNVGERWREDYYTKFSDRFIQVARYADEGNDVAYGNELANLFKEINIFIESLLAAQMEEVEEEIEIMRKKYTNPFKQEAAHQILALLQSKRGERKEGTQA